MRPVDAANRDIFPRRHLKSHEVLKYDPDMPVQIFEGVLPQVYAIQQNLPSVGS
jgi:hypothetical protein